MQPFGITRTRARARAWTAVLARMAAARGPAAVAVLTIVTGLGVTQSASAGSGPSGPDAVVPQPWPSNPDWQQYVQAPSSQTVYPVRIVSVSGDVTDPQALLHPGRGQVTTLTQTAAGLGTAPVHIILDYGHDVGGLPQFEVTAEHSDPGLLAGYSETLPTLTPTGDMGQGGPFGAGDPHRYDTYRVSQPGVITNRYVQGGERYQELTLTTPGSVTLRATWIRFERFRGTPATFGGYFVSSSDLLNRLWYDGAYTDDMSQIPPGTPGNYWQVENGALNDQGGAAGLLATGRDWTDYTMSFRSSIVSSQAGWVVRGQSPVTSYQLILDAHHDAQGPPDTLQEVADQNGATQVIGEVKLPFTVNTGTWYSITTTVSGATVTTSIDGRQVATFGAGSLPKGVKPIGSGTVGFSENITLGPQEANFADLSVTTQDHARLFASSLGQESDLAAFDLPGANTLPLMLDGAKRDQAVWSGDLSVSGPTLYYSSYATDYMKDSLALLGSYQLSSGFVEGGQTPWTPLHTGPDIPGTVSWYSASYSMYWVVDLADYYQFTGDSAFARQEWPAVERELAWNASQVDKNGLFSTDSSDAANWHLDAQTGEQTYENVLYYQTLLDASVLARAAGQPATAARYTAQAAAVKGAINAHLFNPATGVYDISTAQRGYVAQDANVYAVLYGIAPATRAASILSVLQQKLSTSQGVLDVSAPAPAGYNRVIGPFMGSFQLWALLADHQASAAITLMTKEWGPMTTNGPASTFWESMGADGSVSGQTSMAHAWSTGPTSALSQYILGISPAAPGYSSWLVEPQPANLSWAQGQAPTPHGPIIVKWGQVTGGGHFEMQVQAPAGTTGSIGVPTIVRSVIKVNGQTVWDNGTFHPAAGITSARVNGPDVILAVGPAPGGHAFLVDAQAAG